MTALEQERIEQDLCPYCGSANFGTEEPDAEHLSIYYECADCDSSWVVHFKRVLESIEKFS